jgi:hypothetical protein
MLLLICSTTCQCVQLHSGTIGHGAIESPVAIGESLLIFSNMPTFAVVLMFYQLSWLVAVKPALALE